MAHTIRDKARLIARVKRIRGQVEGLQRALEGDRDCADVLHQITAVRGAISGLMTEVLQEHIRGHIAGPLTDGDAARATAAEELIGILRTYLK